MYDFGERWAQTYEEECECKRIIQVSTQQDNNPEYYIDINIKCVCGKSVLFNLPVN